MQSVAAAIVSNDVEIVSYSDLLRRAGWHPRADADTNLDRLHEVLMAEQTHLYLGAPGCEIDRREARIEAARRGCLRVTFTGA